MRIFSKDEIRNYWPWGTCMYYVGYIFIVRNWTSAQDSIRSTFKSIWKFPDVPVWLLLFAEGTRCTPDRLSRSQDFARERGLPVLKHIQYPRYKGFAATVNNLHRLIDAVYDVTMYFPDKKYPSLVGFLDGSYPRKINYHIRRYAMEELPLKEDDEKDADDSELRDWLYQVFTEKDELLDHCAKNGEFPGPKLHWPHGDFMQNMKEAYGIHNAIEADDE